MGPAAVRSSKASRDGGDRPTRSRDGRELYFIGAEGKMMAAEVKAGVKFDTGIPKALFDAKIKPNAWFDVSRDGHFLVPSETGKSPSTLLTVAVNWTGSLKK